MKIAITGAGGFLGQAAVDFFLAKKDVTEVRGLYSRELPAIKSPGWRSFQGQLSQAELLDEFLAGADLVIHLANRGYPLDQVKHPADLISENLAATESLLAAMKRQSVRKIIFSSSGGALYSPTPEHTPLREEAPTVGRSAYAVFKLAIENLLQLHERAGEIQACVLRISNPYGVGLISRERQGFVGIAVKRLLNQEILEIWGSDQIRKDFIYVDDVMTALDKVRTAPNFPTGIFHVSSGVGTSLREVIQTLESLSGRKLNTRLVEGKASDALWTALDSGKLQAAVGWSPQYDLTAGLRELLELATGVDAGVK